MNAAPVSMPRWPACLLGAAAVGCAAPGPPPPASDPAAEVYTARGNGPGWHLTISGGRMTYVGDYGDTRIAVARPEPRPTFNGRRYETAQLTVDVTYSRCNDGMSGHGYEHQVMVITPEGAVRGCGGERRPE